MLHILIDDSKGILWVKCILSPLTSSKCVATLRDAFFGPSLNGAYFFHVR